MFLSDLKSDDQMKMVESVMSMLSDWISPHLYPVESNKDYESSLAQALDHFQLCCLEMISFFLFIYFLKTKLCFDVFGDGPIAMLINCRQNNRSEIIRIRIDYSINFHYENVSEMLKVSVKQKKAQKENSNKKTCQYLSLMVMRRLLMVMHLL